MDSLNKKKKKKKKQHERRTSRFVFLFPKVGQTEISWLSFTCFGSAGSACKHWHTDLLALYYLCCARARACVLVRVCECVCVCVSTSVAEWVSGEGLFRRCNLIFSGIFEHPPIPSTTFSFFDFLRASGLGLTHSLSHSLSHSHALFLYYTHTRNPLRC